MVCLKGSAFEYFNLSKKLSTIVLKMCQVYFNLLARICIFLS